MKVANTPAETTWENPLIPSKLLRQLYTAMAELRLLEEHRAASRRSKSPLPSTHGEEACRASTILSLLPGDLTSDPTPGIATAFLRGAELSARTAKSPTQLPTSTDAKGRLNLAIGAALGAAYKKKGPVVLSYVYPGELNLPEWKPILRLAATNAAPIIFVALPEASAKKPGQLSHTSTACGVPGIPVDAADAVALYRVAQESLLRARAGGGPVLMECIPFQLPGKKSPPADPILSMRNSLIHRKIADEAWFDSVATRFIARLKTAGE